MNDRLARSCVMIRRHLARSLSLSLCVCVSVCLLSLLVSAWEISARLADGAVDAQAIEVLKMQALEVLLKGI